MKGVTERAGDGFEARVDCNRQSVQRVPMSDGAGCERLVIGGAA